MNLTVLEDVLQYTGVSDVAASPDGKSVFYRTHRPDLERNDYEHMSWMFCGNQTEAVDESIAEFVWADSSTAYYARQISDGCTEFYKWTSQKTEKAGEVPYRMRILTAAPDGTLLLMGNIDIEEKRLTNGLQGAELEQAKTAYALQQEDCLIIDEFPYWMDGAGVTNKRRNLLFVYKEETGLKQLTEDTFQTAKAVLDADRGMVYYSGAAFTTMQPLAAGLYSYDLTSETREALLKPGDFRIREIGLMGEELIFVGCYEGRSGEEYDLEKKESVYGLNPRNGEIRVLHEFELSFGPSVFSDIIDSSGQIFQIKNEAVYFLATWHDEVHLYRVDQEGVTDMISSPEPVVLQSFSVSDTGIFVIGLAGLRLQELYRLEEDGSLTRMTDYNGYFTDKTLAEPEPLMFIDKYNHEITGFVLRPVGEQKQERYPAILDIHGGPPGAYGAVFFHEMQYWAAKGYYVMFCNPTGGTGRGAEFSKIIGGTGGSDYEDIMHFVDLVLEKYPEIDPERLGVTGGSYGGFMTNWIIGHTDRFAAAASQRSTANNITEAANKDCAPGFVRTMTDPAAPDWAEKLWDLSPLKYIDEKTKTPTLFLHSLQDYRCYHVEALQMYAALQYRNIPTRMVLFKNESHGLSRMGHPRNRLRRLREITEWMDRFLRPQKESAERES